MYWIERLFWIIKYGLGLTLVIDYTMAPKVNYYQSLKASLLIDSNPISCAQKHITDCLKVGIFLPSIVVTGEPILLKAFFHLLQIFLNIRNVLKLAILRVFLTKLTVIVIAYFKYNAFISAKYGTRMEFRKGLHVFKNLFFLLLNLYSHSILDFFSFSFLS